MITDAQFLQQEAEILAIFDHEATRSRARREIAEKVAHPEVAREMAAHEARVARILELAQYEAVVKDTASFLF